MLKPVAELRPGVGVALSRDSCLLLGLRRAGTGWGEMTWSMPGGTIEGHESADVAAAREVAEETGIAVTVLRFVGRVDTPSPRGVARTVCFEATDFVGAPVLCEPHKFVTWNWFRSDTLPMPLFPPTQDLLRLL